MPLYEYHCQSCGETFEKMMRWSETGHSPACPNCQSDDTRKKVSSFASIGGSSIGASSGSSCGSGGRFT